MAEIGTGVAEAAPPAAAAPVPAGAQPASSTPAAIQQIFVDAEGKLLPGWKEKYVPQDLRHEKIFDTYGSLDQITKSLAYYNKRMRDTGRGIPDESWSPTELATYHQMRGRPATPDAYGLKKPDFIPDDFYDNDRAKRFMEFAHKEGFTLKEVQKLDAWNNEEVKQGIAALKEQQEAEKQQAIAEAERILLEKCGANLKTFQHLSDKFIEDNTANLEPVERAKVIEAMHDPRIAPYLVPIFAQVQSKHFSEAHQVSEFETPARVLTPEAALSKGKQMQALPAYANGTMRQNDPEGYKTYQTQIDELFRLGGVK